MSKDIEIPVLDVAGNKVMGIFQEMRNYIDNNLEYARPNPEIWQPYNAVTGKSFGGANRMRLAAADCDDPRWMTAKQAEKVGGSVREGAEEHRLYFYERGNTPADIKLRVYSVYNAKDIDGLPELEKQSPEKLKGILQATAEAHGIAFGKNASIDDLASTIIMKADRDKFGEDRNSPSDQLRRCVATEFLKAEHGIKVDTVSISDQMEKNQGSKVLMQVFGDAGKISDLAMQLAPRDMRVEKQILPAVEREMGMSM
ncbi:MAG: ArdC-like ssDNA-binding domain-containing protein [Gallionella sp.]